MMTAPRRLAAKVRSPRALARELAKRRRGRRPAKIVFTNGCFDIVHKGHVTYLEKARRLGDLLVVALNTDASVKRLKGESRPVNGLADRLEVIAALESVDYVTWFDDDTPLALIQALNPDVLVKGGDWKPAQIVGSDHVLARGGKVRSLPYVEGRSTTRILERARSAR
jgi:rfaE bifunctional protein nucleotidyltransferase chain/domain